jgi:hypothetical protein
MIVGLVCDGCGGSEVGDSNNEVGARLVAGAGVVLFDEMLRDVGVRDFATRIPEFEKRLCERILSAAGSLFPPPALREALQSYFLTTIHAFIVDRSHYLVFGCGDGFLAVNSKLQSFDKNEGGYLTGRLLDEEMDWKSRIDAGEGALRIHAQGETDSLNSLLLATDGFEEIVAEFPDSLARVFEAPSNASRGYDQKLLIDFRFRFWHLDKIQKWLETRDGTDDRSFLLVRRVSVPQQPFEQSNAEETNTLCSNLPTTIPNAAEESLPRSPRSRRRTSRNSSHPKSAGIPTRAPKD